jgi:hypothetical protein
MRATMRAWCADTDAATVVGDVGHGWRSSSLVLQLLDPIDCELGRGQACDVGEDSPAGRRLVVATVLRFEKEDRSFRQRALG